MPFKSYAAVAVALIAARLFCALVSMSPSDTWVSSESGSARAASATAVGVRATASASRFSRTALALKIASRREMHARVSGAMSGSSGDAESAARTHGHPPAIGPIGGNLARLRIQSPVSAHGVSILG
jgi:hypothetical protein